MLLKKLDAYQLSKALLLNERSEFNSKPELEIYADDVKCSHGSSSGSLDKRLYILFNDKRFEQKRVNQIIS